MRNVARVQDLIEMEIDGSASAAESRELRAIIESDADAGKLFEDQKMMAQMLGELSDVIVPEGLGDRIFEALPASTYADRARISMFRGFRQAFTMPQYSLGIGIALGALLFWIGTSVLPDKKFDERDAVGTAAIAGSSSAFSSAKVIPISAPGFIGSVSVRYSDGFCLLHVEGRGSMKAAITVDPALVSVKDVAPALGLTSISIETKTVTIESTNQADVEVLLSVASKSALPASIVVSTNGQPVFDREIGLVEK
jgi:hypothetical protein